MESKSMLYSELVPLRQRIYFLIEKRDYLVSIGKQEDAALIDAELERLSKENGF